MSIASVLISELEKAFGIQFQSQHAALANAVAAAILPELALLDKRLKVVEVVTGVDTGKIPKTPGAPPNDTNPSTGAPDASIP